jgi:hypothetical protein
LFSILLPSRSGPVPRLPQLDIIPLLVTVASGCLRLDCLVT